MSESAAVFKMSAVVLDTRWETVDVHIGMFSLHKTVNCINKILMFSFFWDTVYIKAAINEKNWPAYCNKIAFWHKAFRAPKPKYCVVHALSKWFRNAERRIVFVGIQSGNQAAQSATDIGKRVRSYHRSTWIAACILDRLLRCQMVSVIITSFSQPQQPGSKYTMRKCESAKTTTVN